MLAAGPANGSVSESVKIALTAAVTLLGGLTLFGLQKFLLEPVSAQLSVVGKIGFLLVYHAERYANPLLVTFTPDSAQYLAYQEAKVDLRRIAAELFAATSQVKAYWLWRSLGILAGRRDVEEAVNLLIGMSNALFVKDKSFLDSDTKSNCAAADQIRRLLCLMRVRVR